LVSSQPIGAVTHLAMFLATAARRGIAREALAGTSQNDFLMETAITIAPAALPPRGSFQVECDLIEFAIRELPRWNPVSISGYNYREAGADAVLESALALAHAQAVAHEMIRRGHAPESFLSRISFFLNAHSDFFEEVAKFRAIRRAWAVWVRDVLGVQHEPSQRLRFHVQTSGVSNTARHAHVNIARSMTQALSAVLGGMQSLHVNGFDEAVSIPSEHAAMTALRSQYVLLHETGVARSADPLGGSYLVESLTDQMQERVARVVAEIDELGGVVAATESGWVHSELARLSFEAQKAIDDGDQLIVGVNTMTDGVDVPVEMFPLPPDALPRQLARLAEARRQRNESQAAAAVADVGAAAGAGVNVMPAVERAVAAGATLGEIGESLRQSFGRWDFPLW
jgi:methylmalonyl-CoA mutase N-terminal domain/subunit